MNEFVESFATQQLLPPWEAEGAISWGFAIRLTEHRVRAYLDRYFNGGYPDQAPYHYTPLPGPQFGLVSVGYFPNIASQNLKTASRLGPGETTWDHLSHTQVSLTFPVLRQTLTKDNLVIGEPVLVWVEPFIFSDNDSVVFSSRAIWGSDMYLASIARPVGLQPHQLHLDLGMIGIKKFSPRSMSELLAVLHIRTGGDSKSSVKEIVAKNPDIEPLLRILLGSGAFLVEMAEDIGPSPYAGGVELNNLKQFRDCYDMGAAIYRGIVASSTTHTEVKDVVIFDPAKVEIAFMRSDSIAELLTDLLNAEKPTDLGPPTEHVDAAKRTRRLQAAAKAGAPSPPDTFKAPLPVTPNDMDWDMDRVVVKVEFGFAFSSHVHFAVLATIHTYGLARAKPTITPPHVDAPAP